MLGAAPASAQEIKQLGTFKAWTAWTGTDANGAMCYISAQPEDWSPKEVGGNPVRRSPIHFLIINRKGLGTKNEVQTQVGYPFHPSNANVTATVDGKTFPMVTEGEAAWLAVEADEQVIRLHVRDHGIGISPRDQERIFLRFERAADERQYAGAGLGLWITSELVKALGGRISLHSVPGQGAAFTVVLPRRPTTVIERRRPGVSRPHGH